MTSSRSGGAKVLIAKARYGGGIVADLARQLSLGYDVEVKIRLYVDPETDEPHIYAHGVTERELRDVLARPLEDRQGRGASRVAIGQTRAGRYLRVIYVPDPEPDSVFVITAIQVGPKALKALRRRRKRRT